MGCCQSNLLPPSQNSNNKRKFVDHIKESSVQSSINEHQQLLTHHNYQTDNKEHNQQVRLQKIIQLPSRLSEESKFQQQYKGKNKQKHKSKQQQQQQHYQQPSYSYSTHNNMEEGRGEFEDSRVSIFEEERKKMREKTRKRLLQHADIHPEEIQRDNRKEIQRLMLESEQAGKGGEGLYQKQKQSQLQNQILSKQGDDENALLMNIFPRQQQLRLSSIFDSNNNYNNNNKNNSINRNSFKNKGNVFDQQQLQEDQQLQQQGKNKSSLSHGNENNDKINNNQTERQLRQLHGQLTTMILLWEKDGNGTKRLRFQEMKKTNKNQQSNNNNNNQSEQLNNKNNNHHNDANIKQKQRQQQQQQRQQEMVNNQIEAIWQQQEEGQQRRQQQEHVKNNILINDNKIGNNHNDNNIKSKPTNNLQMPNNQHQNHRQQHYRQSPSKQQPRESQQSSQQQQQRCLLSNPTKILNDSLIDDFGVQKEEFYFGKDDCRFPKWIETDRKSFQVKAQDVLSLLPLDKCCEHSQHQKYSIRKLVEEIFYDKKHLQHQDIQRLQKTVSFMLVSILSVIKLYKQQNKVNLISYRTNNNTSIFYYTEGNRHENEKQQAQQQLLPKDRQHKQTGFKIFFNGAKRLYPFEQHFDGSELFLQLVKMIIRLYLFRFYQHQQQAGQNNPVMGKAISEILYNLTGWIPEIIMVSDIAHYDGVFERLNNNFIDGNTVITFVSNKHNIKYPTPTKTWGLKHIDEQRKEITLFDDSSICNNGHRNKLAKKIATQQINQEEQEQLLEIEQTYKWSQFIGMIGEIHVNWNPLIYDYQWKTENVFFLQLEDGDGQGQNKEVKIKRKRNSIGKYDGEYIEDRSHQYLLKIPPSEEDIELRVFLQVHYQHQSNNQNEYQQQHQLLMIQLYDYTGTRATSSSSAIRSIKKHKRVYSDVLIFQASKEKTEYVLVVRPFSSNSGCDNNLRQMNNRRYPTIKYTISAFTFIEVSLQQLPQTRVVEEKLITTYLQESHCGYGINSPYFLNNFYLQLEIPPLQTVRIFVSMPIDDCRFEMNLIANPDGQQNLTRLNLQHILGDIITSEQFQQGKGYMQIDTKYDQYFFMITNHTKCKGQFHIIVQVIQTTPKYLTYKKQQQIQLNCQLKDKQLPPLIFIKEKFFYQQAIFSKEFKWLPTHSGPRKRLKSNTHGGYQPFQAFKQFFKNPFVDYKVDRYKKLQFSIQCKSYRQYFDGLQSDQQDGLTKNEAQPPTISLAILKVKRPNQLISSSQRNLSNESLFKIIVDDAFYVPFGFGYWTKVLEIDAGQYRFVFPKMEKQFGEGVFSVYHIEK